MRLDDFAEWCDENCKTSAAAKDALKCLAEAARAHRPQTHTEMVGFDDITDAAREAFDK